MAEYAAQDRANMLVAFWDGRSAGTKMMIEIARKMGIPSHIVPYNRLQVYTAPMRSETFALNPLIPVLNITRKSGGVNGEPFAPSANLVYPLIEKRRAGTLTDKDYEEYRLKYIGEMRASYKEHMRAWNKLLDMEAVILTCYCTDPDRCHRTILAKDILAKLGAEYHGEVIPAPNQEYQDEPEQQDAPVMVANPKQTSLFSK